MFSRLKAGLNTSKKICIVSLFVMALPVLAGETNGILKIYEEVLVTDEQSSAQTFRGNTIAPESLGPVVVDVHSQSVTEPSPPLLPSGPILVKPVIVSDQVTLPNKLLNTGKPWTPAIVPFLDPPSKPKATVVPEKHREPKNIKKQNPPAKILMVDVHPKMAQIAILIDDLGYNRRGMDSSLALPVEVALAILPETPFSRQTALTAQKQKRITLLHAPMENQRKLELGPGGLYAKMTEDELKTTLKRDLDGLPGIQGVNNHMGSLLTTKPDSMKWVMEVLKGRSLFFIDSLTSAKSVAEKTAQEHGLKTVSRDVFLDNIRTEQAIDKQFSRLLKLARRHGSVLAIGHPYPETMAYLKKRLKNLEKDGVRLVPLSKVLISPPTSLVIHK
jgi:polysaccharide deacetylase 2 family uncharacterized protein YibQ